MYSTHLMLCQAPPIVGVNVLQFCHHLTVLGKCHHEGDGGIEQERAEEVGGIKSGGSGQDDR